MKRVSSLCWRRASAAFLAGLLVGIILMAVLPAGADSGAAPRANGEALTLGFTMTATKLTGLRGAVGTSNLQITNTAAGGTALDLRVTPGNPPLKVSSKIKVVNLNADLLDGKHGRAYMLASVYDSDKDGVVDGAVSADLLDGKHASAFLLGSTYDADADGYADAAESLVTARGEAYLGGNTGVVAREEFPPATPGTPLVSFPNLPPGTYLFYGVAEAYVDNTGDIVGLIQFDLDNGTTFLQYAVATFSFDGHVAGVASGRQSSGFTAIITLATTTTVRLSASSRDGLTSPVAGGGSRLGYLKIA